MNREIRGEPTCSDAGETEKEGEESQQKRKEPGGGIGRGFRKTAGSDSGNAQNRPKKFMGKTATHERNL